MYLQSPSIVMQRSYHGENAPSHQHWEAKHRWARLVARWGTTCETRVTLCFAIFLLPARPCLRPCVRYSVSRAGVHAPSSNGEAGKRGVEPASPLVPFASHLVCPSLLLLLLLQRLCCGARVRVRVHSVVVVLAAHLSCACVCCLPACRS